MKWLFWLGARKQKPETLTSAELAEREKDKRVRANAKKQLLPIEPILGVNLWNVDYHPPSILALAGQGRDNTLVTCWFDEESAELEMIAVGSLWDKLADACTYWVKTGECNLVESENYAHQEMIARALLCLGIDSPDVLAQFDPDFSLQEQLELRLSMPREFWPKTWLEEGEWEL